MTIKLIFCLHRLPSLTREAFQLYWRDHHAPLVREHSETLGILRYVQSHSEADERLSAIAATRAVGLEPYDGVCEIWYESIDALTAMRGSSVRAAGQALLEDEKRFIDLPRSPLFFANENLVIGEPLNLGNP